MHHLISLFTNVKMDYIIILLHLYRKYSMSLPWVLCVGESQGVSGNGLQAYKIFEIRTIAAFKQRKAH
jgi:hypothetical protein